MSQIWFLILSIGLTANLGAQNATLRPELLAYPDTILYNGNVLTTDAAFTLATGVAIRDGVFMAVGGDQHVLELAGPDTQTIDLQGKTVLPGFIDSHQHLYTYAERGMIPSLQVDSVERALEQLKEFVEVTPPGQWIIVSAGMGSDILMREEMKIADLDAIAPENPLAIGYIAGEHLVNSKALELANFAPDLTGLKKDPQTGAPTGYLTSWATQVMEWEVMPWPRIPELIPRYKKEMLRENAAGLTTVTTRIPGYALTAVKEIWQAGELTMRWRVSPQIIWNNPRGEAFLKRLGNLSNFGDDWLKIIGLSVEPPDSTSGSGNANTRKPKLRSVPTEVSPTGWSKWTDRDRSDWKNLFLAVKYGWDIAGIHSQGDRANDEVLSVYETASKEGLIRPGQRLTIDHGLMLTADQVERMKELGVIPSMGMKYIFRDPKRLVYQFGADRVNGMTVMRSLIDAGIFPAMEADTAAAPDFHPLWQMEKAITRVDDETGRTWNEDEGVTREQALRMYTSWSARYTGDEASLGSIEVGKLADLVILDGNYLTVSAESISEIPVVMTMVGGKIVYRR